MDNYIDSVSRNEDFVSDISELTPTLTSQDAPLIDLSKVIADTIFSDGKENSELQDDELSEWLETVLPEKRKDRDIETESLRNTRKDNFLSVRKSGDSVNCDFTSPGAKTSQNERGDNNDIVSKSSIKREKLCDSVQCEVITTTSPAIRTLTSPSTPVHSRDSDSSFVFDTRFNDSLTGLLGSPPPDSPLAGNPFFGDLQAVLVNDCTRKSESFPKMLLETLTSEPHSDVFTREQKLQDRFTRLQNRFPDDIARLSQFYRDQAAIVETDRFTTIHNAAMSENEHKSVNLQFDVQLHSIMDRVEQSLRLLEDAERMMLNPPAGTIAPHTSEDAGKRSFNQSATITRPRPLLSRNAIRVMEAWYERNLEHPYPVHDDIVAIAEKGAITTEQVKKWFANKRNRSNNTRSLTEIAKRKRQIAYRNMF